MDQISLILDSRELLMLQYVLFFVLFQVYFFVIQVGDFHNKVEYLLHARADLLDEVYQELEPQIDLRKARENACRVSCSVQIGEDSCKAKMLYDEKTTLDKIHLTKESVVWVDRPSVEHAIRLVLTSLNVRELIGVSGSLRIF